MKNILILLVSVLFISCGKETFDLDKIRVVSYEEEEGFPMDSWYFQGDPVEGMEIDIFTYEDATNILDGSSYISCTLVGTKISDNSGEIELEIPSGESNYSVKANLNNSGYSYSSSNCKEKYYHILVGNYKEITFEVMNNGELLEWRDIDYSISPANVDVGHFAKTSSSWLAGTEISHRVMSNINFKIEIRIKGQDLIKTRFFYSESLETNSFFTFEI